jgi:hypothetical protein
MPGSVAVYAGDPVTGRGSATAPGAGTTIASVTLGVGRWEIDVIAGFGATGDVGDNIQLAVTQGSPSVTKLYPLSMGAGVNAQGPEERLVITVYPTGSNNFGTATVAVQNIAAGGAGSIYNAAIIARPLLV